MSVTLDLFENVVSDTISGAWMAFRVDPSSETIHGWVYDESGMIITTLTPVVASFDVHPDWSLPASRKQPVLCGVIRPTINEGVWIANLATGGVVERSLTPSDIAYSMPFPHGEVVYWLEVDKTLTGTPGARLFSVPAVAGGTPQQLSSITLSDWDEFSFAPSNGPMGIVNGDFATRWGQFQQPVRTISGLVSTQTISEDLSDISLSSKSVMHGFDSTGWQYGRGAPVVGQEKIQRITASDRDAEGSVTTVASSWGTGIHKWWDVARGKLWILDSANDLHSGDESSIPSSPEATISLELHPTHGAPHIIHKIE